MKLYFAPLEGITTYTYRNLHNEMFGMCDAYFAPFISPTDNEKLSTKNMRGILPLNNTVNLKVQCLANSAKAFVEFSKKVIEYGYDEVNLNLGCPSGTVVKKNKGSGALKDLEKLDDFLCYIFSNTDCKISVKTRTGYYSHSEFKEILDIYNTYPIHELIIHPRIREEYYSGKPNMDSFSLAYSMNKGNIIYNGDIESVDNYNNIIVSYPEIKGVMIGRGAIKNPAIFREIKGGKKISSDELIKFTNELEKRYLVVLESEIYTLQKLKEIWVHTIKNFNNQDKILKAIKKSKKLTEFNNAINCLPII